MKSRNKYVIAREQVNIQDNPRNTTEGDPQVEDKGGPSRLNFPCGRPKETRIELNSKWKELIKDEKIQESDPRTSAGVSGKVEYIYLLLLNSKTEKVQKFLY